MVFLRIVENTVVATDAHIELRQASNGAWYPLVAQEGEPSFTSYYQVDAKYYWELAASDSPPDLFKSFGGVP